MSTPAGPDHHDDPPVFDSDPVSLVEMLSSADRIEDFLAELAQLAVGDVRAALACGLSVRGIPASRLLAGTSDDFARRMDEIQYLLDDGPCLSALRENRIVEVSDIAEDQRWPAFSERGRAEGAGASLSIPLAVGERTVGALNLYAHTPNAFTDTDRDRAVRLAAHASGAVALAARLAEHENHAQNLTIALASRSTIDQAIGVLIGRHHITAEAAFTLLRERSQKTNVKLRDVAAQLITEATKQPPGPTPPPVATPDD